MSMKAWSHAWESANILQTSPSLLSPTLDSVERNGRLAIRNRVQSPFMTCYEYNYFMWLLSSVSLAGPMTIRGSRK